MKKEGLGREGIYFVMKSQQRPQLIPCGLCSWENTSLSWTMARKQTFVLMHQLTIGCVDCVWRRKWQTTPVLLPGKSHGQRSLVGCSPWGHKESDTTEWLSCWSSCNSHLKLRAHARREDSTVIFQLSTYSENECISGGRVIYSKKHIIVLITVYTLCQMNLFTSFKLEMQLLLHSSGPVLWCEFYKMVSLITYSLHHSRWSWCQKWY